MRRRQLLLLVLLVALLYCGLLSGSKSFILVTALLFCVWFFILPEKNEPAAGRLGLLLVLLCLVAVALSSRAFGELLEIVYSRFSSVTNLSDLTTGRTELWQRYFEAFAQSPRLFLLGEGYTDVTVGGGASHNTILQGVYQFGFPGFLLLLLWQGLHVKALLPEAVLCGRSLMPMLLMGIGVFLPWMALDILFFDEFFLFPVFFAVGVQACGENAVQAPAARHNGLLQTP